MRRARSAREMGWCSRTRFKRICRLTWREVERVARRKSRVSIFRTLARLRLVVASTINLARDLRTHRECRRVPRRFWARHFRAICAATAVGLGRSEEHTSELQSQSNLVCRLLLEKKKDARSDSIFLG